MGRAGKGFERALFGDKSSAGVGRSWSSGLPGPPGWLSNRGMGLPGPSVGLLHGTEVGDVDGAELRTVRWAAESPANGDAGVDRPGGLPCADRTAPCAGRELPTMAAGTPTAGAGWRCGVPPPPPPGVWLLYDGAGMWEPGCRLRPRRWLMDGDEGVRWAPVERQWRVELPEVD